MSALYVGDLHHDVTEALLGEIFSSVGPVSDLRVFLAVTGRSAYAYVKYLQPADAKMALDTMNFDLVKGKPMRIMWWQPDPILRKSGVGNIFIKNLHKDINNKELYDTFSVCGSILSSKLAIDDKGISQGYGFIHYETQEEANLAISKYDGIKMKGKKVFVGNFMSKEERINLVGEVPKIFTNLYVKNIIDMTEAKLYDLFQKYGKITSCVVKKNDNDTLKNFGFVAFESPVAAETALRELHDKDIDGPYKLYVAKAQKKSEREAELRMKYGKMKLTLEASTPVPPLFQG